MTKKYDAAKLIANFAANKDKRDADLSALRKAKPKRQAWLDRIIELINECEF